MIDFIRKNAKKVYLFLGIILSAVSIYRKHYYLLIASALLFLFAFGIINPSDEEYEYYTDDEGRIKSKTVKDKKIKKNKRQKGKKSKK